MSTVTAAVTESPERLTPPGRLLRNAGWLTGGRLLGDFLGFLLFVVISRHFGPEGLGLFAYGFAVAAIAYSLAMLGLNEYGIRELARLPSEARPRFFARLVITEVTATIPVLIGLAVFLMITHPPSATIEIVLLLTAHQLLLVLARLFFAPSLAAEGMVKPAVAEMVCRAGGMLMTIGLVLLARAPLAVALTGFPLGALALLLCATVSNPLPLAGAHVGGWRVGIRETIRGAWAFGASDLIFILYARADLLMITWIRGAAAAGIYSSALKFLEVGVMPIYYLGLAAYPGLSRLFGEPGPALARSAKRLVSVSAAASALIAWLMYFVIPAILIPLLGTRFEPAHPVLKVMAFVAYLTGIEGTLTRLLFALHLQVRMLRFRTGATLLNILLNLVLIPRFGIVGALAASIITLVLLNFALLAALRTELRIGPIARLLLHNVGLVAAACAAAILAGRLTLVGWVPAVAALVPLLIGGVVAGGELRARTEKGPLV